MVFVDYRQNTKVLKQWLASVLSSNYKTSKSFPYFPVNRKTFSRLTFVANGTLYVHACLMCICNVHMYKDSLFSKAKIYLLMQEIGKLQTLL